MEYPKVTRAHIVPRGYLRNFADGEMIGVKLVRDGRSFTTSVRNVGYRKHYYRRFRPDGTSIDDVEWGIGHLEDAAVPVIREIRERWPLSDKDKAIVGEFVALQLIRGPRFRSWSQENVEQSIREMHTSTSTGLSSPSGDPVYPHNVDRVAEHLRTDTQRLTSMLALLSKVGSIMGSMRWTLLEFEGPFLATSDQPVHVWPLERESSRPLAGRIGAGILNALEIRLPMAPDLALVMNWICEPDPPTAITGARHHPPNINAFTVAEADTQWFHLPGVSPRLGDDVFLPVSIDLSPGYGAGVALRSPLRQRVDAAIQPKIGADLAESRQLEITRVRSS